MFHSVVPGEAGFGVNEHVVELFGLRVLYQALDSVVHLARQHRLIIYHGLRVHALYSVLVYLLILEVPVEQVLINNIQELVNDLCLFLLIVRSISHLTQLT